MSGLGLFTVYLDLNNNGKLDAGDKTSLTDINGKWSFGGLVAATYVVAVAPVNGYKTTTFAGSSMSIELAIGTKSTSLLIGVQST